MDVTSLIIWAWMNHAYEACVILYIAQGSCNMGALDLTCLHYIVTAWHTSRQCITKEHRILLKMLEKQACATKNSGGFISMQRILKSLVANYNKIRFIFYQFLKLWLIWMPNQNIWNWKMLHCANTTLYAPNSNTFELHCSRQRTRRIDWMGHFSL